VLKLPFRIAGNANTTAGFSMPFDVVSVNSLGNASTAVFVFPNPRVASISIMLASQRTLGIMQLIGWAVLSL